jgi:hypothetical protein
MLSLFAQRGGAGGADAGALGGLMACFGSCGLVFVLFFVIMVAIGWKIFTKAGQPGWAAIVPIYNTWVLVTEICKKEPLWFILTLVPIANIVASWVICQELARKFGKSDAFGIGLFFLGPIFGAMLAFGDAEYRGRRGGRSRAIDDYDDEEDDRPRKRSARDEDDEDDAPPPPRKKKRRDDYDDE